MHIFRRILNVKKAGNRIEYLLFLVCVVGTLIVTSNYGYTDTDKTYNCILELKNDIEHYQELHKDHALPKTLEILQSPAALTADESIDGKTYGPFIPGKTGRPLTNSHLELQKHFTHIFYDYDADDLTCHEDCQLYDKENGVLRCRKYNIEIWLNKS